MTPLQVHDRLLPGIWATAQQNPGVEFSMVLAGEDILVRGRGTKSGRLFDFVIPADQIKNNSYGSSFIVNLKKATKFLREDGRRND